MLYGSREYADRGIKDFTYKAETGFHVEDLPEEYKTPDDMRYTRTGKEKENKYLDPPRPIREEPYDPESELASFLYIQISGQIETSNIVTTDLIQAKYTFITGNEWDLIEGNKSKESQFAKRVPGTDYLTWNLDFQVGYRTLSPEGWPKLVIELKSPGRVLDTFELKGYSCVHVPTFPGQIKKNAKIFCPVKENWWNLWKAKIFGPKCDLISDPEQIVECDGREVTSVFYVGDVHITFNVVQRNFERFGYRTF
jgi:hypothetical protein